MTGVEQGEVLFVGSYTHALDAKRRLTLPSVWRSLLGADRRLFAFPCPEEKCVYLYTAGEMMRRVRMLREGRVDADERRAVRSFAAGGEMLLLDAQGRIRLNDALLAHAEVKDRVVLVGALTRIELWSAENFDLALPPTDSSAAEDIFYGGF